MSMMSTQEATMNTTQIDDARATNEFMDNSSEIKESADVKKVFNPVCPKLWYPARKRFKEALDDLYENECKNIIKFTNYQFIAIPSIIEFINRVFVKGTSVNFKNSLFFHEIVLAREPVKMFADIDLHTEEHLDNILTDFIIYIKKIFKLVIAGGKKFDIKQCRFTSACKKGKVSVHFTYLDAIFENIEKQKEFWLIAEAIDKKPYIDMSCYNKMHPLRTIYSSKTDDTTRILKPIWVDFNEDTNNACSEPLTIKNNAEAIAEYFINVDKDSYIEDYDNIESVRNYTDKLVMIYSIIDNVAADKLNDIFRNKQYNIYECDENLEEQKKEVYNDKEVEKMRFALMNLPVEYANIYSKWLNCLFCLNYYQTKTGTNLLPLVHEFSARGNKYHREAVEMFCLNIFGKVISKDDVKTPLKPASLYFWLKEENKEAYKEFLEKYGNSRVDISNMRIDKTDEYIYINFVREFQNKTFESYNDMINALREKAPKVLARILLKDTSYIKKDDCDRHVFSTIKNSGLKKSFKMFYKETVELKTKQKEKLISVKFEDIVDECINMYKATDVIPEGINDKDIFNLWRGFAAKMVSDDKYDAVKVDTYLNFIKEVICNDNEEHYIIVINWLASMVQRPSKIIPIFLLLISQQGSGKSVFVDLLQKYVVGLHVSYKHNTLEDVFTNFNSWMESCVLNVIEEIPAFRDSGDSRWNKFKDIVSSDRQFINNKGETIYEVKSLLHIIINTNHRYSLPCEQSDRRCFALEVSEKYMVKVEEEKTNKENYDKCKKYWDNMYNNFLNQDFGDMFFTYLMKHKIDDSKLKTPPITKLKQDIIESSKNSAVVFVEDIKNFVKEISTLGKFDNVDNFIFNDDCKLDDDEKNKISLKALNIKKLCEGKNGSLYISSTNLFSEYIKWCKENNEKISSQTWFGRSIEKTLTKQRKTSGIIYYLQ